MLHFRTSSTLRLVAILLSLGIHQSTWKAVESIHPACALVAEHMKAQEQCIHTQRQEAHNSNNITGCRTEWDEFWCWYRAEVGQVVNVSCSDISQLFDTNHGFILRNCTNDGWTETYPSYENACEIVEDVDSETETTYFSTFRQVYTAGYATSLISLISAIFVFTAFRKFHCTRNYIHINLFASFILRASAIFIKDGVLFADEDLDHCFMSTVSLASCHRLMQN